MHSQDTPVPVKALKRGLDILEFLSLRPSPEGVTLTNIAEFMGLKLSTTHNLVKTLMLCGFVQKAESGRYALSWKIRSLERPGLFDLSEEGQVMQILRRIGEEVGYDLAFGCLCGGRRIVLARVLGQQVVRVDAKAAESVSKSLWSLVTGRVLAAFCESGELERIVELQGMPGDHWGGIAEKDGLKECLGRVREQGFADDVTGDVASMAVPVFVGGQSVATVGVVLPAFQYTQGTRKGILGTLVRGCRELGSTVE